MKYWLELLLIVGLVGRRVSDLIAAGFLGHVMDGDAYPDMDVAQTEWAGAELQRKPLTYHPGFPAWSYFIYASVLAGATYLYVTILMDTIAMPGLVFGALGVPPLVMQVIAWANAAVMFWYVGGYLADGTKALLAARALDT